MHRSLIGVGAFEPAKRLAEKEWLQQCPQLAAEHPAVILAHWHTFRADFLHVTDTVERDRQAEDKLLQGLADILATSPETKLILYSESFTKQPDSDSVRDITRSTERLAKKFPEATQSYSALVRRIQRLGWPDTPEDTDIKKLRDVIRDAVKP